MNVQRMTALATVPAQWRSPAAVWALVVTAVLALMWDTAVAMVDTWSRSETFAHCYLVAPISAWLAWRDRARLVGIVPRPNGWTLVPFAGLAALWLVGDMASANAATQFALVVMLVLTVPAVLGWAVARALAFPLAFLLFMVPVGEFMLPAMMDWTADFTVAALRLTGIPVYREGLQFVIPSGTWSVVEACSGVRYLIASFMVGSLFAHLNYQSMRKRLLFVLVSLLVPLLANWLRAYLIVLLGHVSGNQLAVGVDHLIYGWVFFGLVIGLMFFIGSRWADPLPQPSMAASVPVAAAVSMRRTWAMGGLCAVLAAAPMALERWVFPQSLGEPVKAIVLPTLQGASAQQAELPLVPEFQNPDATASGQYRHAEADVFVHIAYYRAQRQEAKLVSIQNTLVKSESTAWRVVSRVSDSPGAGLPDWTRSVLLSGTVGASTSREQRLEVRQVFWVDGELTASAVKARMLAVRGRLLRRGDEGAMITLMASGEDTATNGPLTAFIRAHQASLTTLLSDYRSAAQRP